MLIIILPIVFLNIILDVIYVVSFILFSNSIMLDINFSTLQLSKLKLREIAQSHTSEGVRESQIHSHASAPPKPMRHR